MNKILGYPALEVLKPDGTIVMNIGQMVGGIGMDMVWESLHCYSGLQFPACAEAFLWWYSVLKVALAISAGMSSLDKASTLTFDYAEK